MVCKCAPGDNSRLLPSKSSEFLNSTLPLSEGSNYNYMLIIGAVVLLFGFYVLRS